MTELYWLRLNGRTSMQKLVADVRCPICDKPAYRIIVDGRGGISTFQHRLSMIGAERHENCRCLPADFVGIHP